MVHSPVYQIDFTVVNSGKHLASTKRRIRWRWGFSNQDALAAGLSSTACRGEEHDVTVVWSIVSGKCNVLADGQEVHVSNSRTGNISCSWTMKGNHVLQVIAHALAPQAPMRQYDLLVDGQSFFEMPKVFHLGLQTAVGGGPHAVSPTEKSLPVAVSNRFEHNNYNNNNNAAAATTAAAAATYNNYSMGSSGSQPGLSAYSYPSNTSAVHSSNSSSNPFAPALSTNSVAAGASLSSSSNRSKNIAELEAPRNVQEEEVFLAEAIKNSLQETRKSGAPPTTISPTLSKNEDLILNFFDDPVPPPSAYVAAPPPSYDGGLQYHENQATPGPATVSPVPMQLFASPQPVVPPPVPQNNFQQPVSSYTPLTQPSSAGPFVPPSYKPPMTMVSNGVPSTFASQPQVTAPSSFSSSSVPVPNPFVPTVSTTIQPGISTIPPKGLGKDANQAFEKFANMDLLGTSSKRANPFDTSSNGPSLSSLAEMNAGKPVTVTNFPVAPQNTMASTDKKPIMKSSLSPPTNPNPNTASMVLATNQQGNWGGYGASAMGGGPMMQPSYSQQQQPQQAPPILGHGYSQSGYAGYSMYGGQQQSQPQPTPMYQTPTSSVPAPMAQPSYYGGYAAQPPNKPTGNPW